MHYTMTLWKDEHEMKNFSKASHHLTAMKDSKNIAKEIRILTYDGEKLPSWKEAKQLLKTKAKVYQYN